ncbi:MAG TPA: hypothetical protein VK745_33100 [Polyangiaceae bacterium]|jgi:hypothetical protein|nr:hypothetical protein [Polyangiaceae bacterium]
MAKGVGGGSFSAGIEKADDEPRALQMERGVAQLLYHYLPHRTVDWDDGRAIVKLGAVRLKQVWSDERVGALLSELAGFFEYWRRDGGQVDPSFPDPLSEPQRYAVGEPVSIEAFVFETAYRCRRCSRLYFLKRKALRMADSLRCKHCNESTLRQFNFVFVHGCGDLHPIEQWLPTFKKDGAGFLSINAPRLKCQRCGDLGEPAIPSHSERVRDMRVVCLRCNQEIQERLTANCERCLSRSSKERATNKPNQSDEPDTVDSSIARSAMRVARYNQSEAYYPQSISILRLDRANIPHGLEDRRLKELQRLVPADGRAQAESPDKSIGTLLARLKQAQDAGRTSQVKELYAAIQKAALLGATSEPTHKPARSEAASEGDKKAPEDIVKSARESYALLTTVQSTSALAIARDGGGLGDGDIERVRALSERLGFEDLSIVADLPIISSTFAYTRRAFQPTYDELSAKDLPTELRAFPAFNEYAAQSVARPELVGTVPVLAREAEHEGILFSLSAPKVLTWLERNGISVPESEAGESSLTAILRSLEPIDRFHDRIWATPLRRYLFGLVHTLSHLVMRAATRFAGAERTSLSEYVFLPLLGGVVYDNASVFQLGGLRTLARDHLESFLDALSDEASRCIYDPDCIDHRGACHGCIHSPEICCRVFNHGLSRAFLLGGHAPWADVAESHRLVGFWEP